VFFVFVFCAATHFVYAQQIVPLDDAIKAGAASIEDKLQPGVKVAVLNFDSPSPRLSNYVIDELAGILANGENLTVVDRQNLPLIQQEMNFQLSGEVSDASVQAIGMKLGAQYIISGSIEDVGSYYRLRFRIIEVVSAAIQYQTSTNVVKNSHIRTLMADANTKTPRTRAIGIYPHGLNYSTGRKVGAGFLNLIFGLGSFTMGDWAGGLIIGGSDTLGLVLSQIFSKEDYFALGFIPMAGAGIYGFIRPFQYDKAKAKKNGTYFAVLDSNPMEYIKIALAPDNKGIRTMSLSYSLSF
jgi:TolB-like protein